LAEGPDVKVHALGGLHFDDGVLARCEVFGGSEFEPAGGDAVDGRLYGILVLTDFASWGAFDIADEALAVFHFQMHDAEAVEGNDGLFGLLGLLGFLRLGAGSVKAGLRGFGGGSLAGRRLG